MNASEKFSRLLANSRTNGLNADDVDFFFDSGKIDVNYTTACGNSFLHTAIECKASLDIIQAILKRNPNINAQNHSGVTLLMLAMARKDLGVDLVLALLDKNPNLDLQDRDGYTVITYAIDRGVSLEFFEALLAQNPNLNLQDKDGETALMFAARRLSSDIVRAILSKNPDLTLKDKAGWDVLKSSSTCSREIHSLIVDAYLKRLVPECSNIDGLSVISPIIFDYAGIFNSTVVFPGMIKFLPKKVRMPALNK